MMRASFMIGIGLLLSIGCTPAPENCRDARSAEQPHGAPLPPPPPQVSAMARPAASLIFDREPGPYGAEAFTYRSDWPSTRSFEYQHQIYYFREHFHDVQGNSLRPFDYTYRRFDTYREGIAVK